MATAKEMTFRRYGRSYHLRIETAAELELAVGLDEAHWVATNAPVSTINCDATFLQLLDSDGNGRITSHDLKVAIRWLLGALRDRDGITARSDALSPDEIDTTSGIGRRADAAVRKMLRRSGLDESATITLDEVRRIKEQIESTPVSEAGVVLPEAAGEEEIRQFIADAVAVTGGAEHPSGECGIGREQLEEFLAAVAGKLEWRRKGEIPPGEDKTDVMPLGADTPAAYEVLAAVRGKIDQYFAQCEAAALDPRFVQRMGWTDAELEELDFDDPTVIEEVLTKAPLAKARAERKLSFDDQVNPYYAGLLERFRTEVMQPVVGERGEVLSAAQWGQIKSAFAAHQDWCESKGAPAVADLGMEKLEAYLDERFAAAVRELIAASDQAAFDLDNIRLVEKLLLYQANLIDMANNFVSFPHLYDPDRRAMFEMGTLVMDGRRFNLAVRCDDRARHAEVAKRSNMFVIYVEVSPAGDGGAYEVAVPVTSGGRGNLCVSKRGVFHDLAGTECDARVVHIIENPISIREALVSPFKRLGRLITGKIESLTARAEKKLDTSASAAMSRVAPPAGAAAAPAKGPTGLATGGMLMGAGVAVAVLGSAVAYITKTFAEVEPWTVVYVVVGAVLLVALPTSIVAFLKLRRRDLSAILEGSGWAINARMRITRSQRRFFTQRPDYPKGAKGVRGIAWTVGVIVLLTAVIAIGGALIRRSWGGAEEAASPSTPTQSAPAE